MAELTPKPFSPLSGFMARIFKGAPAYYAKPDLQQYFDSLEYNLARSNKLTMGDVVGSVFLHPDSSWNLGKTSYNLRLVVTDPFTIDFGKFKVPFVGNSLDYVDTLVFEGNSLEQEENLETTVLESQITNVVLLGKSRIVTFLDDPLKGGITGPNIVAPLESSNVLEYYDFSLGVCKGLAVPETQGEKEVLCVVAQFTFYFDVFWKPMVIQNFRTSVSNLDISNSKRYPVVNKVLSSFGQFDWFNKVLDSLTSLALRIDGSNDALVDLYVNKGNNGRFKIITRQDYATTILAGIVRLANDTEVFDTTNNSVALTPYGMYLALGSTKRIYELGVWNMNVTDAISFPHNLGSSWLKAVPSSCSIINDAQDTIFTLFKDSGATFFIDDTNITVQRASTLPFKTTNFSATTLLNRGYAILDVVGVAQQTALTAPIVSVGNDLNLTILLGSTFVETTLEGVINSFSGNLIGSNWSVASGSTPNVQITADPLDSRNATFKFLAAGFWELRFSATASDGVNSSTGSAIIEVTVISESVALPIVNLKHFDNTTTSKDYPINGSGNIILLASVTNLPTNEITSWDFSFRSTIDAQGASVPAYTNWDSQGFSVINNGQVTFYAPRAFGLIQFRARVFTTAGTYTSYSTILQGNVIYTPKLNIFEGYGDPYLPNTGALGVPFLTRVNTSLQFRVRGTIQDPNFKTTWVSETYYLKYDPNNVQQLPNTVVNYTNVVGDLFLSPMTGVYNCSVLADRTALKQAIKSKLLSEGGNMFTNIVTTVADISLGDDVFVLTIECSVLRGTSIPNEVLATNNPPTLARRVRITGNISGETFIEVV